MIFFDDNGSDANAEITGSSDGNMLDVEATLDRALAPGAESGDYSVLCPDPRSQSSVVDSLTQAFTPQKVKVLINPKWVFNDSDRAKKVSL